MFTVNTLKAYTFGNIDPTDKLFLTLKAASNSSCLDFVTVILTSVDDVLNGILSSGIVSYSTPLVSLSRIFLSEL